MPALTAQACAALVHPRKAFHLFSQGEGSISVHTVRMLRCVVLQVIAVVKGLTKTGITICATIHNPTPYCFNLFDRLMILLHGRVVYSGENGELR